MAENPILDSIWMRCFWEAYDKARAEHKPMIEFSQVDELVVEYSKTPILEFRKKFFGLEV